MIKSGRTARRPDVLIVVGVLSALLIFQLAAALVLNLNEGKFPSFEPSKSLFSLPLAKIQKISISERDPSSKQLSSLVLHKEKSVWRLAENVPAKASSISHLLNAVTSLKKNLPVASGAELPERFNLNANNFAGSITLDTEEPNVQPTVIYFGAAANGLERYFRLGSDDTNTVYSCQIQRELLSAKNRDWIDNHFAAVYSSQVAGFAINDFTVHAGGTNQWTLINNGQKHELPRPIAESLLTVLDVPVDSILGSKAAQFSRLDQPDLILKIELKNGSKLTYSFTKIKNTSYYVLRLSDSPYYFEVADKYVDDAKKLNAAVVLKNCAAAGTNVKLH
jgi:hypothetical protein